MLPKHRFGESSVEKIADNNKSMNLDEKNK